MQYSRRQVLQTTGIVGALGLAGCVTSGSTDPRYRLSADHVGSTLSEHFTWTPRGPFANSDQERMDEVIAAGSRVLAGIHLHSAHGPPTYVEHDGTFYEINVEQTEKVERERWVFWFDLIDTEPPEDAEIFMSSLGLGDPTDIQSTYGLSELDTHIVERAEGQIPTEFGYRDLDDEPPGQRGHVFLRLSPDETDLLPDPPFTHVSYQTSDETKYARAVADQYTVELNQFQHTATPIAESATAFEAYLTDTYLTTTFERSSLPDEQREILDAITDRGTPPTDEPESTGERTVPAQLWHEETPPLSDAYQTILDRLGLADVPTPEPRRVNFSDDVYFAYTEMYFAGQLEILR